MPLYDLPKPGDQDGPDVRIVRSGKPDSRECFVARINLDYVRRILPGMIRRSFGESAAHDYDFAVPGIYGKVTAVDLRTLFFSVMPQYRPMQPPQPRHGIIIVERVESRVVRAEGVAPLLGLGIWELQVAHKGVPLAMAFEQTRRRDLLLSLGVEALLVAAIVFLLVATRRMQRLAEQKMNFVAGVSHELRTPVSAISMLSRNQADGLVEGAERVRQYGELIHQQSRRLNEMVEQTLQYAGIHSGVRPPAHPVLDLRALIDETVEARRGELARSGFEIETSLDAGLPEIRGDAHWLRTAVDNLLSNALKHAVSGRWIRVTAEHDQTAREVRIAVQDRGAGIDAAERSEVFKPFARGRAAIERQVPGSGLGLSLVRSAAEAHRGAVTLVSEPGRGCTFTLHLPV